MSAPSRLASVAGAELLNPEDVSRLAPEWDRLAAHASDANSFYERWFLEPSLHHLDTPRSLKILTVRDANGSLIGLMPVRSGQTYGRSPLPALENWLHYNQFLGVPLVARGAEHEFWTATLACFDRDWPGTDILYLSEMPAVSAVTRALLDVCRATRRPSAVVHRYSRALLCAGDTPEHYWAATVRKKKRKEIARLENRLAELGEVRFEILRSSDGAADWIEDFLTLEAAGWKGQDGAALALETGRRSFFEEALSTGLATGKAEMLRLRVGQDVVAMLVNLLAGDGALSFKIAYDESYARFSPGILIEKANLQRLSDPAFGWMDSCAVEDHPMINSLWRDRREMVRIALPRRGVRPTMLFRAVRLAEAGWSAIKQFRQSKPKDQGPRDHDEL